MHSILFPHTQRCQSKCFLYLLTGMRILSYATAVYDYAATATTQLSLTKGDRVMVLSKTGQDKGWWKGEHCETGKVILTLFNPFQAIHMMVFSSLISLHF